MGILEQVTGMKRQGYSDNEIAAELSQNGVSPREINDALKQAQIKNAVSDIEETNEMQQSVIQPEEELNTPSPQTQSTYKPRAREETMPEEVYTPQPQEQYSPPQEFYQPDAYSAYPASGADTDTIIEISDQVFTEKTKKIQKQVETTAEITSVLQAKTESISERLNKVENIIDKLQIAILEKVGSYGQNLESIKKEMSMMQDSFSKMVNPIASRAKEKRSLDEAFSEPEETMPQKKISKRKF